MKTSSIQRTELERFTKSLSAVFSELRALSLKDERWYQEKSKVSLKNSESLIEMKAIFETDVGQAMIQTQSEDLSKETQSSTRSKAWVGSIKIALDDKLSMIAIQNVTIHQPANGPQYIEGKTTSVHLMENNEKTPSLNPSQIAVLNLKYGWVNALESVRLELRNQEGECSDASIKWL